MNLQEIFDLVHSKLETDDAKNRFAKGLRARIKAGWKPPTEDQKKSGEYPKTRKTFAGLPVTVENPSFTVRTGKGKDGKPWSTKMLCDYGYIPCTTGKDGEGVDVYLGPDENAPFAYVVHQVDPATKESDEDKVMLGFADPMSALKAYFLHYDKPGFFGGMSKVSVSTLSQRVRWHHKQKYHTQFCADAGGKTAKAKGITPQDVDRKELVKGLRVEMEHTDDRRTALKIALDHLAEIPDYYSRLSQMEGNSQESHFDADFERKHPRSKTGQFGRKNRGPGKAVKRPKSTGKAAPSPSDSKKGSKVPPDLGSGTWMVHPAGKFHTLQYVKSQASSPQKRRKVEDILAKVPRPTEEQSTEFMHVLLDRMKQLQPLLGKPEVSDSDQRKVWKEMKLLYTISQEYAWGSSTTEGRKLQDEIATLHVNADTGIVEQGGSDDDLNDEEFSAVQFDAEFERKHPRASDGRFGKKAGSHPKKFGPPKKKESKEAKKARIDRQLTSLGRKLINNSVRITEPGQAWGLYEEMRQIRNGQYKPFYTPDELPDPVSEYRSKDGKVTKMVPLPESSKNWPSWFKRLILKGRIALPQLLSNISIPEEYPNNSGVICYGFKNSENGKKRGKAIIDDEVAQEYQRGKWEKTIPALEKNFVKMKAQAEKDMLSGNQEAAVVRLMMTTGIRADTQNGSFVKAKTREGEVYAEGYHSYGATSLKANHIEELSDGSIKIRFTGKTGKTNTRIITADPDFDWTKYRRLAVPIFQATINNPDRDNSSQEKRVAKLILRGLAGSPERPQSRLYDPVLLDFLKKAKKRAKEGKLFDTNYGRVSEYIGQWSKDVPDLSAHNFRHRVARQRVNDAIMAMACHYILPEDEKEYKQWVKAIGSIAGDFVNDTPGALLKSYADPASFNVLKKAAGVTWQGILPPKKTTPPLEIALKKALKK